MTSWRLCNIPLLEKKKVETDHKQVIPILPGKREIRLMVSCFRKEET